MAHNNNECFKVEEVTVKYSLSDLYKASLGDDDIYQIRGEKKGIVLILNNSFTGEPNARIGSDLDVEHMKNLWTQMGCDLYQGIAHEEKTADEMKSLIRDVNDNVGGYCFLVFIIMTHGEEKDGRYCFLGKKNKSVEITNVLKSVNNKYSEQNARNIPKLFIFQACRGGVVDRGVVQTDGSENPQVQNSAATQSPSQPSLSLLPTSSNILVAHSTMDGYVALRSPERGSWFINGITNVFMKHAHETHVADLLVKVNKNMQSMSGNFRENECKAMSQYLSSLTKRFYLFPGQPN